MKSVLSDKHFHNEQAAYDFVEARLWPQGPVCPHCKGLSAFPRWAARAPGSALTSATRAASPSP